MIRKSSRFTSDKPKLCKAIVKKDGSVDFNAPKLESSSIEDILEEDKRYGVLKPANGEYFTYQVLNEDEEITKKEVLKVIRYSFLRVTRRLNIKFRKAKPGQTVDLRIEFRTVETDPDQELTPNTLMYHYFPISNVTHPLRGLCVVNKEYHWTSHGKSIPLSDVIPDTEFPDSTIRTYDFDQVYTHELGHGLGLPHAKDGGHIMSPNYGIMAEWLSEQDVKRLEAKYPPRKMTEHKLKRWLKWLFYASDR